MVDPCLTLWIGEGAEERRCALLRDDAPTVWTGVHRWDAEAIALECGAAQRTLARALERPLARDLDALTAHGRRLFDLCLPGPIKSALRQARKGQLRIVMDGPDGRVPWHLLHDGEAPISMRWQLGELATRSAVPPIALASPASRLLVVADPADDLPAARYEGEALMRDLGGGSLACDLRLGRLRRADFLRLLPRFRLLHFAGHHDPADDNPAGWRLADGRIGADAFGEIAGGAAPWLVFANACQSADGLASALLDAGVRHVVGTTVDLPDLPGAEFATAFYMALREGASVGEAMRTARSSTLAQGSAVWAAYRLFGDPASVYFRARRATQQWAQGVRRGVVIAVRRPVGADSPEGMAENLDAWRAQVRDAVSAHGGRLLPGRTACDRAVFGVPVSYENDAARAARAALSLLEPGVIIAIEAGPLVSTGADVVGPAALAVETTCWQAQSGCYVLPGALRRLGALAHTEDVGGRLRLVSLGTSVAVPEPPLVGRSTELDAMVALADQVVRTQRAAAATLLGPAGIGKSRLLSAVSARLEGQMDVLRGAGEAYEEGRPYAAAAGILRALAEVPPDADDDTVSTALDRLLDRLEAEAAAPTADRVLSIDDLMSGQAPRAQLQVQRPVLRAMLGLRTRASGGSHGRASDAFRLVIAAAARLRPIALLFEDVHWMPAAGRALVDAVVSDLTDSPVLVLISARSELAQDAPAWFASPNHRRIELGPLSARAAEAVLRQILKEPSAEALAQLSERGEGNPLFLRELALSRVEGEDTVPPTVEAVVQARLDRLRPADRKALSAAAVLGRTFWSEGVAALLGGMEGVLASLQALQRARFVASEAVSDLPGCSQWRFAHALQHEVVERGLGRRGRSAWHGRAALWLVDEVPEGGEDRWRRVARHWAAAGDPARAATAWLKTAVADRAGHAPAEARQALVSALAADDVGQALDAATRAQAEADLAVLAARGGDLPEAARRMDAAIGRSRPTPVLLADRLRQRAETDEALGMLTAARARLAEAQALLLNIETADAEPIRVAVERDEAWLLYRDGAYEEAAERLRALLPRAVGEAAPSVNNVLGVVLFRLGDFEGADRYYRRALALAEPLEDVAAQSKYNLNLGIVAERRNDFEGALEWYRRALELQVRLGDRDKIARTYLNLGTLYGNWGRLDRAARYLEEAIRMRERSGHTELAVALANLGEVRLIQGALDAAGDYLERAIALCQDGRGPGYLLPDAWRMLAELHLRRGSPKAGGEAAGEALALALDSADRPRAAVAQRVLGDALAQQGEHAAAAEALAASVTTLESLDEPLELGRAYVAQSRLESGPAADSLRDLARALFRAVGADADLAGLEPASEPPV